ncbi:Dyp-type peroxidase [Pelistega europaea]|uniref:Dyp-type peroxidase n=1 Tax=Pelistega europaea TaxID=106147 RepID=A0A7Y4L9W4_9BURK|nr:Dyp-type peroxidase [Pelistega europaea]NOL49568.1 Dyp-type peroxidase [Pelistega europaea]
MSYQSGITLANAQSGFFIEADFATPTLDPIKHACSKSLDILKELQEQFPTAQLVLTIAFGDKAWKAFQHTDEAKELKPFHPLGGGLAPATQHDLLIHIQSLQQKACFALAFRLLETFGSCITVKTEIHGYRLFEDRGIEGFIDGTENPKGEDIINVGVIPEGQPDAGGSYVLIQKYLHDLKKWEGISIQQQEDCVGRSKQENIEFEQNKRLPDSHLGRVNLKENGKTLEIVRRSLPFGTISGEHGLLFCAYCNCLHNIETQLLSMFGDTDGKKDLLLKHLSTPVSGAYYFAPSIERLRQL